MKVSRALITFAFIADRFEATRDIGDVLTPLFAPIADQLAGRVFDPAVFAERFSEYYGIKVHPLVIADQIERFKAAGLVKQIASAGEVGAAYECQRSEGFQSQIDEAHVEKLLDEFTKQAKGALATAAITLSAGQL